MGPYAGHDKINNVWSQSTLDDRIKNTERSIGEFENATKGLREELKALKEQKRLEDLDAENKRLKAENSRQAMLLSDQAAKIGRLVSEKIAEWDKGYRLGYHDGLADDGWN